MKRIMRIGTWNVQGISTKELEVFREINKHNIDIAALTETKRKGKGTEEKYGYIHVYSGVPKEERARSGVSLAIKSKYKKSIKTWHQVSDRILQVNMECKGHPCVIIAAYGPNNDSVITEKEKFFQDLTDLLEQLTNRKEVLLLGDLNGRTGKDKSEVIGPYGEEIQNDNGDRIIDMCYQTNLRVMNGWFEHKDIHKFTWTQPTRNLKSIIDYLIVKQQTKLKIRDVRAMRGPECGSDHHMLLSKIEFPFRKLSNNAEKEDESKEVETIKYNLMSLRDDSTKFLFQLRLAAKLPRVTEDSPENMYESIKACIHEAAGEALGEEKLYRTKYTTTPWWNQHLEDVTKDKKEAYEIWLTSPTNENRETYRQKRKNAQKEVIKAKNDHWDKTCQEINNCTGNTRANRAWKIVKGLKTENKDQAGISLIKMEEWRNYYRDLLTEDREQFMQDEPPNTDCRIDQRTQEDLITLQDVKRALIKMKNGKAPGPGGLNIELIKAAPEALLEKLVTLFGRCLNGEEPPSEWKKATITSIYKKGNRQNCQNYRGISVLCTTVRLYGRILKQKIENQTTESEEQNGFRPGRSCIDGIFTLKHLTEKRVERGQTVHLTFIDLKKAYDTVPLSKLWTCMEKEGVSELFIRAVRNLYSKCSSCVKMGNKLSEEFQVTKGLRQGCALAPTLFKIYLEAVLKNWKHKCHGMGIPIGDETLYTLLFADDQVVIAGDRDDSSYMFRKLEEEYEKWGLTISHKKTEYMVAGENDRQDLDVGQHKLKNCATFKYLGVTLSNTGKSNEDIKNKIGQGRRVIRQLNSVLWNNKIRSKTKTTIYRSIFESISTYGSETWELTKNNKQKLLSLEMDYWRRSCGVSRMDHVRNDRIREIMKVDGNILDTVERKQLTWYGHLQRMNEARWPIKIFKWIPPEKRKRGRPPRRWKRDIEEAMNARGLKDGDWQDRQGWKLRSEKRRRP